MELLPRLSRSEQNLALFKLTALYDPPVLDETFERKFLMGKDDMMKIMRESPIAEWPEKLTPYVNAARSIVKHFGYSEAGLYAVCKDHSPSDQPTDICRECEVTAALHVVFQHELPSGRTRNTHLDPLIRVGNVYKTTFGSKDAPRYFPAKVSPVCVHGNFSITVFVKDCDGNESGPIDVSYKHFVENARWKQTLIPTTGLGDLNVWFSSWTRWSYDGKINDFDKYENDRFTERMRAAMGMSDVREFRPTDFEAIDKHLAEKEAIERSKRGLLVYEEVNREEASISDRCSKEQIEDLA